MATDSLTHKELLILKHLAQGLTRDQVCQKLNIKRRTLQCYLNAIYLKLDVADSTGAAVWYFQAKVLLPEQLLNLKLS